MFFAQIPSIISLNDYLYSITPTKEGFSLTPNPKPFPADLTLSLIAENQFKNFNKKKQSRYLRISSLFHINKKYLLMKCNSKGLNLAKQLTYDSSTIINLINQLFDASRAKAFLETLALYETHKEVEKLLPDQVELIEFSKKFSYGGPFKPYSSLLSSRCTSHAAELADGGEERQDKIKVLSKQGFTAIFRRQIPAEVNDFGRMYEVLSVRVNSSGKLSVDTNQIYHSYDNKEITFKELRIREKCKHPSIIPYSEIFIVGNDSQSPKMEIGVLKSKHLYTLKDKISDAKEFSLNFILQTLGEAAEAIASLHNEGIFHGDIRPANLVYENNRINLANFQFSDSMSWSEGEDSLFGNTRFLPPEACLDGEQTEKMDIWAFGLVMYVLLNPKHRLPSFVRNCIPDAKKAYQLLKKKLSPETVIPLQLLFKDWPEANIETEKNLQTLIAACLNTNPDKRPSANDVLNVLIELKIALIENYLHNERVPKIIYKVILDYDKPVVQKARNAAESHGLVPCYFLNPEDRWQSRNSSPVYFGASQSPHFSPLKFTDNLVSLYPGRISPSIKNFYLSHAAVEPIIRPKPLKPEEHSLKNKMQRGGVAGVPLHMA